MAVIKNNIFHLSGKCGDTIYRVRNGKTVAYAMPGQYDYDPEKQKNCIAPRSKFGYAVWFASFTSKIPLLDKVWLSIKHKNKSAYHRMVGVNVNLADKTRLTKNNLITPPGQDLSVTDISLTEDSVDVHCELNDNLLPVPVQAIGVIYSYNPGKEKNRDFTLFAVTQELSEPTTGPGIDIHFQPDKSIMDAVKYYQNWIMYFTLIKVESTGKLIWTSTAAVSGINDSKIRKINDLKTSSRLICAPCYYSFSRYS
jgi:hypothetical protein